MQSNAAKAGLAVALIAVAAVLFVVLRGSEDKGPSSDAVTASTDSTLEQTGKKDDVQTQPKPAPKPEVPTILIKGGQPVGGVEKLDFNNGDTIRFKVDSDVSGEIHFHGYDIAENVEAGGSVSFVVPATIEGIFEVEIEDTAVQIAEVTVNP